jgi:hypothetical protein
MIPLLYTPTIKRTFSLLSFGLGIFSYGETPTPKLSAIPGLDENNFDSAVHDVARLDDPLIDGWQTEQINEVTGKQFKKLASLLESKKPNDLSSLGHSSFKGHLLRPKTLTSAKKDAHFQLLRASDSDDGGEHTLEQSLSSLSSLLKDYTAIRSKFKTISVSLRKGQTSTVTYVQIGGSHPSHTLQINATWNSTWDTSSNPPLLTGIEIARYDELTHQLNGSKTLFSDCTESLFRNSDVFQRQLIQGIDHWSARFDGAISRPAAGHGMAIGDVNGDGLEDAYLCQLPGLPNLLLIQQTDGTVVDTALEAGVNWHEGCRSAVLNDLDNDGDLDLVSVLGNKLVVQENDGTGKFKLKTIIDTASSLFSINAVDYDGDQDLDLFVCGYNLSTGINLDDVFANPMPFQDANNGAPNVMLRNDGNWKFTDVTNEVGLGQNNMRFSYAGSWDDFDLDGDLDLYIANDFGRNNLYRNDKGIFKDVAAELDLEDIGPGMSASWGDYNNDGLPDLYVSNMFSSAGNRITTQSQFKSNLSEDEKSDFRRHARGNSLYQNNGDGSFSDVSVDLGVTLGRWAWGSTLVDMDNDGWEDIYVTNGFMTAEGKDRDL